MFSPTLGRFITQDPIGFEAGDQNLYRAVGNNPTGRVDPSGLRWKTSSIDWNKKTITIIMPMIYFGPGASNELAAKWKTAIEKAWSGKGKSSSCGDFTISINVVYIVKGKANISRDETIRLSELEMRNRTGEIDFQKDINPNNLSKYDNFIENSYNFVYVGDALDKGNSVNQNVLGDRHNLSSPNEPRWRSDRSQWWSDVPDNVVAHEAGHLFGFLDKQKDGVPFAGWEGTIMADARSGTAAKTGRDGQSFIDMLIDKAIADFED